MQYNLDATPYESLMLGLFTTLRCKHNIEGCPTDRYEYNEVVAGWSRDGFYFSKAPAAQREPLLSLDKRWPSWRHGDVQSVGGGVLIVGELLYIYASGSNGKGCNESSTIHAPATAAAPEPGQPLPPPSSQCRNVSSTGLAVLRRDGFASITSKNGNQTAVLTTRPVSFRGDRRYLFVNADLAQAAATLVAEVLWANGSVIRELSAARFHTLAKVNSTRISAMWEAADLSAVRAGDSSRPAVRFRFTLSNGARLYAFWTATTKCGASTGFVAAGGPEFQGETDRQGSCHRLKLDDVAAAAVAIGSSRPPLPPPPLPGRVCNVLGAEFGAKGDNSSEDTDAVRRALRSCAGGGGTVLLPAGHTFLLRPLELPSHTTLRVEGNIAGWRDIATWPNSTTKRCPVTPYQTPRAQVRTVPQKEDLLWSSNGSGVTISGGGTIDGAGWQWWPMMARHPTGDARGYWHSCRPSLVAFGRRAPHYDSGVSDVRVEGVTLKDSPFWTFSGRGLLRAVISNVHVTTTGCGYGEAPNTDGFNIQGQDILIEHSTVRNGDDCVPIFPPTRNVTVRNITCECGNGLVPCIWPSMSIPGEGGIIRDVLFDGAKFTRTSQAVVIKSLPSFIGAAINISYKNFVLVDVGTAVMINVFNQGDSDLALGLDLLPTASSVSIENVSGTAKAAGKIECGPGAATCHGIVMRDVRLNITTKADAFYRCSHAGNVSSQRCTPKPCTGSPAVANGCDRDSARGPFVPWVRAVNQSNSYGKVSVTGSAGAPLLGVFPTEADCQKACTENANCTQYTWVSMIPNDPVWTHHCYARCDTNWTLTSVIGVISARRVLPSQLSVKTDRQIP